MKKINELSFRKSSGIELKSMFHETAFEIMELEIACHWNDVKNWDSLFMLYSIQLYDDNNNNNSISLQLFLGNQTGWSLYGLLSITLKFNMDLVIFESTDRDKTLKLIYPSSKRTEHILENDQKECYNNIIISKPFIVYAKDTNYEIKSKQVLSMLNAWIKEDKLNEISSYFKIMPESKQKNILYQCKKANNQQNRMEYILQEI